MHRLNGIVKTNLECLNLKGKEIAKAQQKLEVVVHDSNPRILLEHKPSLDSLLT